METLRTLMIGAMIGAPLGAWGLSWLEGQLTRRVLLIVARLAVLVTFVSAGGLSLVALTSDGFRVDFMILSWLQLPGLDVTFGGRLDSFACAQLALVSVVLLVVLAAWPPHASLRWLLLAWFGVMLASVAGNLGQLFIGWTLSAWASSELARQPGKSLRPVWLMQRVSDTALLAGLGLVWMNFGSSLELAAWTPERMGSLRPELLEGIALCVLVGVIGRCAQLPLTVWLETEAGFAAQVGNSMTKLSEEMVGVWSVPEGHHVAGRLMADRSNRWHESDADAVPAAVLAWWLCGAFLPVGIGLLVRMESLFAAAPHTRLVMVAVGAFTLLLCSASAAAQTNWPRVLSQFAVGQCGLVLVAMGLGHQGVGLSSVSAFFWQSLLIVLLLAASASIRRQLPRLILGALSLLVAGLFGRQAVIDRIAEQTRRLVDLPVSSSEAAERVVLGATEARLWWLVLGAICLSEFLTGFALFRAWFLNRREAASRSEASVSGSTRLVFGVIATVALLGGLGLRANTQRWITDLSVTPAPQFSVSPLLPLSLAGGVLAWWLYTKPSSLPEKFVAALGPFARLSRNRFYWDDLYFLLIVQPAAAISQWLRLFDEQVLGNGARALRSRLLRWLGEAAEPLVAGSAMVGTLTTLSSAAVLVWMLLWLKS